MTVRACTYIHSGAAASVAEIALSALGHQDLDRAVRDVEAMLSSVKRTDRYVMAGYTALLQLVGERANSDRSGRQLAWPQVRVCAPLFGPRRCRVCLGITDCVIVLTHNSTMLRRCVVD
jgi:hypothetical protein